jgi:hypothetical protein
MTLLKGSTNVIVHAKAEILVFVFTSILAKVLVALDAVVHASSLAAITLFAELADLVFRPLIGLSLLVPLTIPFRNSWRTVWDRNNPSFVVTAMIVTMTMVMSMVLNILCQ